MTFDLKISETPDAIRIGGSRAKSMTGLRGVTASLLPEPGDALIAFDAQETAILKARADGRKWREIGQMLHMDGADLRRIEKRIERKIKRGSSDFQRQARGSSSHLCFTERIAGGRKVWALQVLGDDFRQIMAQEKNFVVCRKQDIFAPGD